MVIVMCKCDWGTGVKLPPHYHYTAGLVEMPNGRREWVPGALGRNGQQAEQREFIHLEVGWDRDELEAFIATARGNA